MSRMPEGCDELDGAVQRTAGWDNYVSSQVMDGVSKLLNTAIQNLNYQHL